MTTPAFTQSQLSQIFLDEVNLFPFRCLQHRAAAWGSRFRFFVW